MASICSEREPTALQIPEVVGMIISHIDEPPDLLNCACLNRTWSLQALRKLYKGSLNDMKLRTPDIGSLNSLFVASRDRFERNISFVDHLLIGPEECVEDEIAAPQCRWACIEKCRPLRTRENGKLLLQAGGNGAKSLAIPFEILNQDLANVFDLILHPGLMFLTIDDAYCKDLLLGLNFVLGPVHSVINDPVMISSLQALSIHRSNANFNMSALCQALHRTDLRLFHLQDQQQLPKLKKNEALQLLRPLSGHRKLKALALLVPSEGFPLEEIFASIEKKNGQIPWPELRGLYSHDFDPFLPKRLADLKKLQIIRLGYLSQGLLGFDSRSLVESIALSRQLKNIDLHLKMNLGQMKWLLEIADGCPALQKLRVRKLDLIETKMTGDQFSRLLKALPNVEFLDLDVKFRMESSKLQDVAYYCPRLSILHLMSTRIILSYDALTEANPMRHMRLLEFGEIWVEKPRRFFRPDRLQGLAIEWKRVFPSLHHIPCTNDYYFTDDDPPDAVSGAELESNIDDEYSDEEMDLDSELDRGDFNSDSCVLRRRMWKLLGYDQSTYLPDQIRHIWQTDFEIKIFDWPIMPLTAFQDPRSCSTP